MPLLPRAALAALALSAAFGLALFLARSLPGDRPAEPQGDAAPTAAAAPGPTAAPGADPAGKAPGPALADPGAPQRPAARPPTSASRRPLSSDAALVVEEGGTPVLAKHSQSVKPIASITKLMTAMVVLDSGVGPGPDPSRSRQPTATTCATAARACAPTPPA